MEQKESKEKKEKRDVAEVDHSIQRKYEMLSKVGQGSYGVVFKASDRSSGEIVAVKKCFDAFKCSTDAQRTFREIMLLQELGGHENIVGLLGLLRADTDMDIYLVFEYMESNLHAVIKAGVLLEIHKPYVLFQLFKALAYIHSGQVVHRDVKPYNLLVNADCQVKVCDFGLARTTSQLATCENPTLTDYVATRWYRAPELLVGSKVYNQSVDMWSCGCILGELLSGRPMFSGTSTMNQIALVLQVTGYPSQEDLDSLKSPFAATMLESSRGTRAQPLSSLVASGSSEALDMMCMCFRFNPTQRISGREALRHPYVAQFFTPDCERILDRPVRIPLDDCPKLRAEEYREQIYSEVLSMKRRKDLRKHTRATPVLPAGGQVRALHSPSTKGPQLQKSQSMSSVGLKPSEQDRLPQVVQQPIRDHAPAAAEAYVRSKSLASKLGSTQQPAMAASRSHASLDPMRATHSGAAGDGAFRMPSLHGKPRSVPSSGPEAPAPKKDGEIAPGSTVQIHGLAVSCQFNGLQGCCEKWDANKGRWNVRLDTGDVKVLKPENILASGLPVIIQGLKGAPELNGQEGTCVQFDDTKGRWNVCMKKSGEVKALKPENLQRPSG